MYTKHKWTSEVYYNFGYVKYLPKDFDENQKYPLVIFLHGAGERGAMSRTPAASISSNLRSISATADASAPAAFLGSLTIGA